MKPNQEHGDSNTVGLVIGGLISFVIQHLQVLDYYLEHLNRD